MRYLILSDIHANRTALDAVLAAAAERWDRVLCLGDVVGYGPDPNEVVERVRELGAVTIRGNHDKACCGVDDAEDFNPIARQAAVWTRAQLRPENLAWLRALPAGPLSEDGLVMLHGALSDEDEYLFSSAQALESLLDSPSAVTFFGHTHFQGGFQLRGAQVEVVHLRAAPGVANVGMPIEEGVRYLLNPGSVGQPRDGDARAAFAIADLDGRTVEYWRVPYEIESVQERMLRAGLPEPLALRLGFGR